MRALLVMALVLGSVGLVGCDDSARKERKTDEYLQGYEDAEFDVQFSSPVPVAPRAPRAEMIGEMYGLNETGIELVRKAQRQGISDHDIIQALKENRRRNR